MTVDATPALMLDELPDLPDALCKGLAIADMFFPDYPHVTAEAKAWCALCPERVACLAFAMANPVAGIWGGTTSRERKDMHRRPKLRVVSL